MIDNKYIIFMGHFYVFNRNGIELGLFFKNLLNITDDVKKEIPDPFKIIVFFLIFFGTNRE